MTGLIFIGKIREEPSFYYYLPVMKTLTRLLCDDSVRTHIIHQPVFDNHNSSRKVYKTFSDGKLIKEMKIDGPYILLRVYLDAFAWRGIGEYATILVVHHDHRRS